jgi:hypothetical protein
LDNGFRWLPLLNAEQAFAQGAEVITFAAEAEEAALLRVESQLAKDGVSTLGFVQTIPELMQALRGVFFGI